MIVLKNKVNYTFSMFIKGIIFDCDGTLVDSEYVHYLSWQYAMQKQGGELSFSTYALYAGKPGPMIAALLAESLNRDCAHEIHSVKIERFSVLQNEGVPGIKSTIHFLHQLAIEKETLEIKLAVASAAIKEEVLRHLEHHQLLNYFDLILSGHDDLGEYSDPEGVNKPKPYIYLHAAKLLGLNPSECLVIEDSQTGVRAGTSAGCTTLAIPNLYTELQDLSEAHFTLSTLAGLTPRELLDFVSKNLITQ